MGFLNKIVIPAGTGTVTSVNTRQGDVVLAKSDVGLGNADNTSDANKPISTLQQAALDLKMNLDGSNSNINELYFDITPASSDQLLEGQVRWNPIDRTLDIGMDGANIVQQVGMETYYPTCKNDDTVEIKDGELVMYAGAQGNSNIILVKRATPSMVLPAMAMGVATEHIAPQATGRITWFGLIRGVQTDGANYGETWVDGEILYNGTTPGSLSKVKPVAPRSAVMVGIVVNANPSNGILFARPYYFPFIEHLSNVFVDTPIQGDVLVYNQSLSRWENSNTLSTPRWDDLVFPLNLTYVNPATSKPDYDYTNMGLLFPQNIPTEIVYITVQMPHMWKEGSSINPHVHVIQNANQQAVFKMDYKWYNIGDAVPAGWTTHIMNQYAVPYTSGSLSQIIEASTMISGTGKTISSILKIKLYRDDNVYTGDILADQFDIHIQKDSFGSETEFDKY